MSVLWQLVVADDGATRYDVMQSDVAHAPPILYGVFIAALLPMSHCPFLGRHHSGKAIAPDERRLWGRHDFWERITREV